MSNSDDLSSYIVVESVHRAGINEAVSNPESSLHNLLDLALDLDIKKENKDTKIINVRYSFKIEKVTPPFKI